MAKKIIVILIMIMLAVSPAIVYASVDELDNRVETESIAGITWDEINEMSQNSPNSLTPIQGLVLWMFMILAFLKLAQKMDSLLQSLGLNVTQTGGRAVGDLIMAGMALKHVGGAISKGMGMFGFGGKGGSSSGGTSGTGSGTGTGSAGGGPTPIPSGSPGSSPPPAGGSPSGGASGTGRTPPSGAPASPAPSGSTSHGSPHGSGASPSSTPAGSTPSSSTASSAETSGASSSAKPTPSRNPVGRAAEWMRGDGFAQGAIKAGAKGGLIGVGVYSAKAGVSKIGSAVSARMGGGGNSAGPQGDLPINNNIPNNQPSADTKMNEGDNTKDAYTSVNPENYQDAKPLDDTSVQTPIPTSINTEDYQDTAPDKNSDDSTYDYSSVNDEGFNETDPRITTDTPPIPATTDNGEHDYESETGKAETTPQSSADNGETWQDTKPVDDSVGTAPIPTSVNNEGWQDSNPDIKPSVSAVTAATAVATSDSREVVSPQPNPAPIKSQQQKGEHAKPTTAIPTAATPPAASIPTSSTSAVPSTQQDAPIAQPSGGTLAQTEATATATPPQAPAQTQQKEVTSIQSTASVQAETASNPAVNPSSFGSVVQQTAPSISSEAVTHNTSVSAEPSAASDNSNDGYTISQNSVNGGDGVNEDSYESAPMPMHNHAISGDLPQSTAPPEGNVSAPDLVQQPQAQSDSGGSINSANADISTPIPQADSVQAVQVTQTQVTSETIRTDLPAATHAQEPTAANNPATSPQSQAIQVSNTTDTTNQMQPTARTVNIENQGEHVAPPNPQPSAVKSDTPARPTAKGKSKNPVTKGRKRRR